jgi:hypothetical protein
MKGFGFIIPNADFSDSPLGSVEFAVSDDELATRYANAFCTSIGDNTYASQLKSMILSLLEKNLWDKMIAIYPMIGDTSTNLVKNLVNGGTDAFIAANASVGTNKLTFSNLIGTGNVANSVTMLSNEGHGVSIYAHFKCTASGLNDIVSFCRNGSTPRIYQNGSKFVGIEFNTTQVSTVSAQSATSALIRVGEVNNNTFDVTLKVGEETKTIASLNYNESYPMYVGNNIGVNIRNADAMNTEAGATLSSGIRGLFKGEMYFYAIGRLSSNEEDLAKSIFDTFVESVKTGLIS